MAEAFINSICKLIMIAGEQTTAPYVGVSAQIDVMQDFMEGDMLDVMTGAEDITKAPELWEGLAINEDESILAYQETIDSFQTEGSREVLTLDDQNDIYDGEKLKNLIEQLKNKESTSEKSRIFGLDDAAFVGLLAAGAQLLADPNIRKGIASAGKFLIRLPKNLIQGLKGMGRLKTGIKALAPTLKNAQARNALLGRVGDAISSGASTAAMLSQEVGTTLAQVTASLEIVVQLKQMSDIFRFFTPNVAALYDSVVRFDDTVENVILEINGIDSSKKPPKLENEPIDLSGKSYTMEEILTKLAKGETIPELENRGVRANSTEPTPVKTPTVSGRKSVAVPRVNEFSINDALRYICRELSIVEKEFKLFNSRLAMDKDEIPKFLAGKEQTIFAKDIGLGEILFRALNIPGKTVNAAGVVSPTEILSIAEQFKQAFPTVEVIDPITKKKSTVSIFEIIMQAQSAKVIELGPGFLKWYPDLDVLDSRQAVTTTPVTGV